MKTMCPPGYHLSGFVATQAVGYMMYNLHSKLSTCSTYQVFWLKEFCLNSKVKLIIIGNTEKLKNLQYLT